MWLIGTLVVLGLVGADASNTGSAGRKPRQGSCAAVEVASPQDPSLPARTPSFSAAQIIDLRITAVLRRPDTNGIVRFKVFTPRGYLYQAIVVPFVTGTSTAPQARHIDGSTRAVLEQQAQPASGGAGEAAEYRIEAQLPVAGTLITTEGLYGRWTVEPWLDGAPAPCLAPKPFLINP